MAVGLTLCPFSRAADAVFRSMWTNPRSDQPDFSQTFVHGADIPLSWKVLNGSGIYDLWLISGELDAHPLAVCLARAIDLGRDGNFTLTSAPLPPKKMTTTVSSTTTKYSLCFKPHERQDVLLQAPSPSYCSPSFSIVDASEPSDIRRHALPPALIAPRAASSPPQSANSILSDTTSPTSEPDPSYPTISPGAAAGLAIGLILAVALLAALEVAYLMWWRRRRRPGDRPQSQPQLPAAEAGEGKRKRRIRLRWRPWGVLSRLRWVDREDDVPPVTPVPLLEVESGFISPQLPVYELQGRGMEGEMKSKTGTRKSRRKSRYAVKVNSVPVELEGG
ncbi:hypothetical protein B0T22DRAFT_440664 [Podospora appendiculata]|uniref:Uncharacterized protein n=1 Tax=Podospora appendiculata TaxID=314037 RepID=A0AAE0XAQ0_9PEZI|nr:hypothetical protein B0T22DRAFT_440664 [Podospora appendiculata]